MVEGRAECKDTQAFPTELAQLLIGNLFVVNCYKASEKGLQKVDLARKKKGWRANAAAWYMAVLTTEATLKRFSIF